MELFGKKFSNWWLLLLPAILLVCLPVLLMVFFAANNFAGAIIGPPAIWNRTRNWPSKQELAGHYVESERQWDQQKIGSDAVLDLRSDGSMRVSALPEELGTSRCTLSGSGNWSGPDQDHQLTLDLHSDGSIGSCESGSYSYLELVGQSKPYGLYWVLGDPDSGTGIWFKAR